MSRLMKRLSIDTETTGLDLHHGAKPFMVQMCDGEDTFFWEWYVDPLTREPKVRSDDVEEILGGIEGADELVLQNAKFDVAALATIGVVPRGGWPWNKTRDTLLAGHLLGSNKPHTLEAMVLLTLGINIQPLDDACKVLHTEAKKWLKDNGIEWRLAAVGLPEMPSATGKVWKYDLWIIRAVAKLRKLPKDAPEWSVVSDYGCEDARTTLALYEKQIEEIEKQGLLKIYMDRLKVLPIVYGMQQRGITLSGKRLDQLVAEYGREAKKAEAICMKIAKNKGCELSLPKSGNNKSLLDFVFGHDGLALEPWKTSKKTGKPSLDKTVMEHYEATLREGSLTYKFVKALQGKRKRDTALVYMESYKKFWLPTKDDGWYKLFPSLNPTGTDTLRWSSQNPNEQNISKKEGFNLRYCFGPAPGREWWSLDAKNIELRIPAYVAGEEAMVALFERPDEAPYFGSNHLLIFDLLHTKRLKLDTSDPKYLLKAKTKYESTWYQWTKNGNFAVQYGSVEQSGTADAAYHLPGAFSIVKHRFKKIHGPGGLNDILIKYADKFGYVETLADKTVDPDHGYPLLCSRTNYGRVLPTVPLNYFTQGTAMWWMQKAMVRCQRYLDKLNSLRGSKGYYMIMQVHDELVFDFPYKTNQGNLPKINKLRRLMEKGGDDLGLPTPVSVKYHNKNWSEGA